MVPEIPASVVVITVVYGSYGSFHNIKKFIFLLHFYTYFISHPDISGPSADMLNKNSCLVFDNLPTFRYIKTIDLYIFPILS